MKPQSYVEWFVARMANGAMHRPKSPLERNPPGRATFGGDELDDAHEPDRGMRARGDALDRGDAFTGEIVDA